MWIAISGLATFVGAVLLKLLDVLVEGRGSWSRRTIKANLALWESLPQEFKAGPGGQALRSHIEASLIEFSPAGPVDPTADAEEQARSRDFERDRIVREMYVLFNVALAGVLLMAFVFEVRPFERLGAPEVPWWLGTAVAVVVGTSGGLLTMRVVRARALKWTRARWLKHGRQLPADVGASAAPRRHFIGPPPDGQR